MIHRSGLVVLVVLSGCSLDLGSSSDFSRVADCEITGWGTHPAGDFGGGSVIVTSSVIGAGSWSHTCSASSAGRTGGTCARGAAVGDALRLTVTGGTCLINGEIIGTVSGTIDDGTGDFFAVRIQDRGEPGVVAIAPGTPTVETLVASRHYRPTSFTDATLSIADQARVTIPAELPVTNGGPGTGWAVLSFTRADTGDTINCRYRGDGVGARGGIQYDLDHCVGLHGMPAVVAGDVLDVSALSLRVQSGDSRSGRCTGDPETTVTLDLDVTPLTFVLGELDDYTFSRQTWDPVGGFTETCREGGTLVSGDFRVTRR